MHACSHVKKIFTKTSKGQKNLTKIIFKSIELWIRKIGGQSSKCSTIVIYHSAVVMTRTIAVSTNHGWGCMIVAPLIRLSTVQRYKRVYSLLLGAKYCKTVLATVYGSAEITFLKKSTIFVTA